MRRRNDIKAIRPNDVYRALPLSVAIDLQRFCEASKENPAAVIADAIALHLDELGGACHDPTIIEAEAAGAAP